MIHLLCTGKQQVITDGNSNLREHRIQTCSVKRLDLQPLFNPFEKAFHLPAFSIELRNIQAGVGEVVGQESICIVCSIVIPRKVNNLLIINKITLL